MAKKTGAQKVDVSKVHAVSRLLREIVDYPGHTARKSSPEYLKAHDYLVKKKDLPCLACGVRNSTLKGHPGQNPFGARQMETHHHIIEWALANAIDLNKFNQRVVRQLRAKRHHDPIYDKDFTQKQMLEWVDHHHDNLWVLCNVHHRAALFGIHEITFPIWGPQDLVRDSFVYIPSKKAGPSPTARKAMAFRPPSAMKKKTTRKKATKKKSARR